VTAQLDVSEVGTLETSQSPPHCGTLCMFSMQPKHVGHEPSSSAHAFSSGQQLTFKQAMQAPSFTLVAQSKVPPPPDPLPPVAPPPVAPPPVPELPEPPVPELPEPPAPELPEPPVPELPVPELPVPELPPVPEPPVSSSPQPTTARVSAEPRTKAKRRG